MMGFAVKQKALEINSKPHWEQREATTWWWMEGAKKSSQLCLWFDEDPMKNGFMAITVTNPAVLDLKNTR